MSELSLDRSRIRVLLLEGIHDNAAQHFRAAGYTSVETRPGALAGAALLDAVRDVHILGIRSGTRLDAAVFAQARRLMAVGCFCIGTNQVAVDAARDAAVPVFNAPFSNTRSVAELVLGEAILLLRGVPRKSALAHAGVWEKSARGAYEIRGKTLGIVGYGNIGTQLGVLAEALGMRVLYHDVVRKLSLGNARPAPDLDALLAQADIVSLHVPATRDTANMIGARELACMKPTSVLINASRGSVVDLDALAQALDDGRLLGAAIDVFPAEPESNQAPFSTPVASRGNRPRNVILTPHIGGSTEEAQASIGTEVAEKLSLYSDNGSTLGAVNFPQVALPAHAGQHRLLHIHDNTPGVLMHINQVFSDLGVNVAAQYLQTSGPLGYVVIDVDGEHSEAALERLRRVPGTKRTRVLF
jgi:D-3-phosphoglycerate dehydrogenase